jgi:D-alanine-D-alanine ligase-like ATP-grasp enzyme
MESASFAAPDVLFFISTADSADFSKSVRSFVPMASTSLNFSKAAADEIKASAIKAFKALGCAGLARVDFFVTAKNEVIINELNTMPGFTATSVFPKMWAASGVDYSKVITYLLKSAEARSNSVLN